MRGVSAIADTARTPAQDQIRTFVIAAHSDLVEVRAMLAQDPSLLNAVQRWGEADVETAIQAAAHVGNQEIAEFLLARGAPLEICTAAMLGRMEVVEQLLDADPTLTRATGAHGIPLLAHAAFSGNPELLAMLAARGARDGMSAALATAVQREYTSVVRWILEHGRPDLRWKNYRGKTALDLATEGGRDEIAQLLRRHGAE